METSYYYLHTNGQLIWKPAIVVESDPDYFNSSFIVKHWKIDNENEYQKMINEVAKHISGENKEV